MTANGQPENASKIQNEEHEHGITAKRVTLVDSSGNYLTGTNALPVGFVLGVANAGDGIITASATVFLVCSATDRLGTFIQNQSPTNNVWLGGSSDLTDTSNYFAKLGPGDVYTSFIRSTHYAITSTNTATLSFVIG